MEFRPRQWLTCVAAPPGARLTGPQLDGRFDLVPGTRCRVGCSKFCALVVTGVQPVSQASYFIVAVDETGRCRALSSGHNFEVLVNGALIRPDGQELEDGDLVEPSFFDQPLGLRFQFHRER